MFPSNIRNKKTKCPLRLSLVGQIPSKRQLCSKFSYFQTHKAVLKINFTHNHLIVSAHSLSFHPISMETKQKFFKLFDDGHSASSSRHTHEQHLLLNASSDDVKQSSLADRAINPFVQDVCRLFQHWREKCYGKEDGLPLFQRLKLEVDTYNAKNSEQGGKAILQWYEKHSDMSDVEEEPKKKRRKRDHSDKPLIIAICTPLMSRAHKNICQAGELVFLDSSSSMDRFNTSIFIMSTHSSSSGIPLGVILTSDEREETIYNGLELLKSVMPENAFFGRSSRAGPQIFMTDDSIAERAALHKCWPHAVIFLCTFHFLQRLCQGWTKVHCVS